MIALLSVVLLAALIGEAPVYPDQAQLLVYRDERGAEHAVRNRRDWEKRRQHILDNLQQVMGPLRVPEGKSEVEVLEEVTLESYVRKKIRYRADPNDWVPAYLFIPRERKGRLPAMVCLHQTTRIGKGEPAGLGGLPNLHYAQELAERGYVAIVPDYPGFGDYNVNAYDAGYESATMKGIINHRRAVDVLESLPEVDPKRIGAIGHSLGGHNTLFLGVFEPRIRAMVSSCGFNSFRKYLNGDIKGWGHRGYMPRIVSLYGGDARKMPFDFTEILGALAPRAVFINAPVADSNFEVSGVRDCFDAARPVYEKIFGSADRLVAVYPDAKHDFPPEIRKQAYEFLDRMLK